MKDSFTTEELAMISAQLACPAGEEGVEIAVKLNDTNASMISNAIDLLQIKKGDRILELGPGNSAHVSLLMEKREHLHYTALDISELMIAESKRFNQKWIQKSSAQFILYDGIYLPKELKSVHHVLSVNTLYFWQKPKILLNEIYSVLKPGGSFVLVYGEKSYMEKAEYIGKEFCLYDHEDLKHLVSQTAFQIENIIDKTEKIEWITGETGTRNYAIAILRKDQ